MRRAALRRARSGRASLRAPRRHGFLAEHVDEVAKRRVRDRLAHLDGTAACTVVDRDRVSARVRTAAVRILSRQREETGAPDEISEVRALVGRQRIAVKRHGLRETRKSGEAALGMKVDAHAATWF